MATMPQNDDDRESNTREGEPPDVVSALGFARLFGLPTDSESVKRYGRLGARYARRIGWKADKVPDTRWGYVNGFPVWLWRLALIGPDSAAS